MSSNRVLHAAGGGDFADRVQHALADAPELEVRRAPTCDRAESALRGEGVDCLVASCELPDGTGLALVQTARDAAPDVGCVLYGEAPPDFEALEAAPQAEFVPATSEGAVDRVVQLARTTARRRTQTAYPLPARERERLAALDRYDLEDEATLPDLEAIAEHAAEHFDVPQATINVLAADEQRFAVSSGAEWTPIPRQESICTYTILRDRPTVVGDAPTDPRFADSDAVEDMGVRSYAGAPIAPEDDAPPIATLCIYEEHPGAFGPDDAAYLQTLARDAAAVIARSTDAAAEEDVDP